MNNDIWPKGLKKKKKGMQNRNANLLLQLEMKPRVKDITHYQL